MSDLLALDDFATLDAMGVDAFCQSGPHVLRPNQVQVWRQDALARMTERAKRGCFLMACLELATDLGKRTAEARARLSIELPNLPFPRAPYLRDEIAPPPRRSREDESAAAFDAIWAKFEQEQAAKHERAE